ncbi:hypothetical protein BH20ACI4_BH20ACI4_09450 [soil metagenome]
MRTKFILFLSIAVLLLIGGTIISNNFSSEVSGQSQPPSYDENFALQALNVKARAVNENGNSTAVTDLVNEVFDTFQLVVASDVKSRIVNSESLYRTNQRDGVDEIEIVRVVNGLQIEFNTPEFSKTDIYEVRKIRQSLQLFAPQFVGHGRPSEANFVNNVNPTIVTKMSPAEAVFVTLTLIYQKKSNAEYQQSTAERNSSWSESHGLKGIQEVEDNPERTNQMFNAIGTKTNSMSSTELLAIPHTALNILGIEQ